MSIEKNRLRTSTNMWRR